MPLTRLARQVSPLLLAPILLLGGGCELLEQFEDGGGLVNFYSAHHATAVDGQFPTKALDHYEVDTDTGWHVIVAEGYVTTTAITLHRCDGASIDADFYWGALCEDLVSPDLEPFGVGAVQADAGNYCAATITYGPFLDGANPDDHPSNDEGDAGDTVYLRGVAEKGEQQIQFEIHSSATISVDLDLSTIQGGGPLVLSHDEYFAKELTFGKTYDRFFDGIEFDQLDSMDLERVVVDTLELETDVVFGTEIRP